MLKPMVFCCSMLFACAPGTLLAQAIQRINPPALTTSPAYSQAVKATPGTVIWVAGQTAQNAKGELVGKGDLKAQLNQV